MAIMGSQRSKEDDVQTISTSVFVTNFPDQYGAKDLWNSCKAYGYVVDAYIPDRRSKAGKRFGFVRFIKVFDVERLISNLCTVNNNGTSNGNVGSRKNGDGTKSTVNSYAHAVTGYQGHKESMDNMPIMVLDETCINNEDYSLCLLGKVKEFASLTNLKVDDESKISFQSNVAVGSWFSQITQAHSEFNLEERVMWVEIEGVPCKWWSRNTFIRIASRWGTLLNGEELEEDGFHSNRLCICTKMSTVLVESFKMVYRGKECWIRAIEVPGWVPDFKDDSDDKSNDGSHEDEVQGVTSGDRKYLVGDSDDDEVLETSFKDVSNKQSMDENVVSQSEPQSKDPFGLYEIINKKMKVCNNVSMSEGSRKYPPGFTPNDAGATPLDVPDDASDENRTSNGKEDGGSVEKQTRVRNAVCTDANESMCSGHFKKSVAPRTGGSIIQLIDDLVTVGQTIGYDMTGLAQKAKKDWVKELCVSNKVNFVSLQETKMANIDLWCIKRCWGNFVFDYVYSEAVGNSGGILCFWDPNMFQKLNATVSDFFTIVRVVMMGDFNEVRDCSERFGSVFNKQGAEVFNNFIANAGLVEVPLGGCSFTFDKLVEDSWKEANICENNDSIKFMKKLRFLKEKIRKWNCLYKEKKNCVMRNLKSNLNSLDSVMIRGMVQILDRPSHGSSSLIIQEMEKAENLEVAQKAKIKWAIEGDENSKYYHGVLNKKRGRLAIRGVLADGIWLQSPHLVKK
ncbi:RNA-directed DNA polymerase, eukaryota [Tanacetum coccineum]|uniref:RNA-directed DNA polymerase, eukaryota n=1 Tax=Tanacetum coccineum TaxID=301880 RepID=A0ABQ5EU86_9ASTR